jgi:hypothetical protein
LKKARKETDKCEICFEGKKCEKKLQELRRNMKRKRLRTVKERRETEELENYVALYKTHQRDNQHQRNALKNMKASLQEHEAIIIMDFKANIVLNEDATVQVSKEYYQNCQRSRFGAVLYYVKDGTVQHHYYDILSDCTTHNSFFVTKHWQKYLELNFFARWIFAL